MTRFRDIKRAARRDLHGVMQVPALYLRTRDLAPVPVNVRLWQAFGKIGDIQGSRTYPAQMQNETDRIRFDRTEISRIENGAIVSIVAGEAYRLDNTLPPDDQFQTAEVTRLSATEATGLPVPDAV